MGGERVRREKGTRRELPSRVNEPRFALNPSRRSGSLGIESDGTILGNRGNALFHP